MPGITGTNISNIIANQRIWGGFLPIFSLLLPGRTYFSANLSPGTAFIVMYWDCKYFYGTGGKQLKQYIIVPLPFLFSTSYTHLYIKLYFHFLQIQHKGYDAMFYRHHYCPYHSYLMQHTMQTFHYMLIYSESPPYLIHFNQSALSISKNILHEKHC